MNLYSDATVPERVIPLPKEFEYYPYTYDGQTIVFGGPAAAYAYRSTGEALWKMPLPKLHNGDINWTPFLIEGGKTLCLFDGTRTVYRYDISRR